jgi:hypothetical protein
LVLPDFEKGRAFAEKGFLMQGEGTKAPKPEKRISFEPSFNIGAPFQVKVLEEGEEPSFVSDLMTAGARGQIQGKVANLLPAGKVPTNEELGEIAQLQSDAKLLPQSKAEKAYQEKGLKGLFSESPLLGAQFVGETMLSSLSSLVEASTRTAPTAIAAGAGAGAAFGGIGALPGAAIGLLAGQSAAGYNLSTSQNILNSLSENGVDISNKESLINAFADENKMAKIRDTAAKYGVPILAFDIATAGLAGKLAAGAIGKSLSKKILAGLGEAGIQMTGGAGGELAGQIASGKKVNWDDVAVEAIAEVPGGAVEVTAGIALERSKTSSNNNTLATQIAIQGPEDGVKDAVLNLNRDLANNVITPEQHQEGMAFVEKASQVSTKIPETVTGESKAKSIELLVERNDIKEGNQILEQQKQATDEAYHAGIDEEIKANEEKIKKIDSEVYNIAKNPIPVKERPVVEISEQEIIEPQPTEVAVTEEVKLEDEYNSKSVDELIALKKKLYPSPDIETPMTKEEKLLDRVIAKKFSDKQQEIIEKRKIAEEAPRFPSYDDAQEWIKSKSKEYKSKNEFLASQEYKDALPDINALFKVEKADYSKKAKAAMQESGVKIGDRVMYDYVTPIGVETYSGQIVDRQGVPFVRFDNDQKTISGKQSVRWHKGFIKESAPKSVVEQVKPTEAKTVEQLRAEEQAELDSKIENAEKYITDGKVDRDKLTNEEDIKSFDEVYNKYDKLITPLLESQKQEVKPTEVKEKGKTVKVVQPELAPVEAPKKTYQEVLREKQEAEKKINRQVGAEKAAITKELKKEANKIEVSDARSAVLNYLSGANLSEQAINEVSGRVKRARLNTGERELKSEEARVRDYVAKKGEGESLDEAAHSIWDNLSEEMQSKMDTQEVKEALMQAIMENKTKAEALKSLIDGYKEESLEDQEAEFYRRYNITEDEIEAELALAEESLEFDGSDEYDFDLPEEYINNLIEQYEAENEGKIEQPTERGKEKGNEKVSVREASKAEAELAEGYKEAVKKAGKKAKENAKKDFVDRNFDSIVQKLKIQIKCPT